MKTYKQFKDFIFQQKYCAVCWSAIRQDAIKEGFNRHLFDFYKFLLLFRYKKQTLKTIIKKILKYIFYAFAYIGLALFGLDVYFLVKSATIRNETETLALVVDTCRKAPKLCEYAVITGNLKLKAEQKD
jgi:hypothetical protein